MRGLLLGAALAVTSFYSVAIAQTAAPARISTEAFAAASFISSPRLSPDGTHLLARVATDGTTALGIVDLQGTGFETIPMPADQDLLGYSWAGNNRVIVRVGALIPWYGRGDRFVTRAFVYDLTSHKAIPIGPKIQGIQGDDILWIDPQGNSVILSTQLDQYSYPTVFRVDLSNGKVTTLQMPYEFVWDWYADSNGIVRYGTGTRMNDWFAYYRKASGGDVTKLAGTSYDAAATSDHLRLVAGSDEGYALSPKASGRFALYKYNFLTRSFGPMLFESPTNDITTIDVDEATGKLMGVVLTEDRERRIWIDPGMKAIQDTLDKTFRGRHVDIISRDKLAERMIVLVSGPADPGSYYLFVASTGQISRLAKVADKVDRAGLSETKYVSYKARDGLVIPAYLTLPRGRDPKGLPLIIMPHGGPYGVRDDLSYDAEVQFLANRGYAVLQPNYRGSDGYGKAFYEKGEGQWGRAMQDDIDDGMDWLTTQGIVDAKRVCIVGGSYGGYVALWGATRNPERYRCAVSLAGISDMKTQLDYQSDFLVGTRWRKDWQSTVRGDKTFDLASISPINKVSDLKVPVMLVHGDADKRVPPKQTTLYDKALTAAGKPHETYIYPGAGHGFDKAKDEKSYLDRLEAFLTKYNPS